MVEFIVIFSSKSAQASHIISRQDGVNNLENIGPGRVSSKPFQNINLYSISFLFFFFFLLGTYKNIYTLIKN